jgi:hypothetical protein
MSYISSNFSIISREQAITKLSVQEMTMLISHAKLNVKSEDEVIDALLLWLSQTPKPIEEKHLIDLMKQPNWPYVSFEKLVEIFKTFPVMRTNIHIKSIFHNEMKSRAIKSNYFLTS